MSLCKKPEMLTNQKKAQCVFWYHETFLASVIQVMHIDFLGLHTKNYLTFSLRLMIGQFSVLTLLYYSQRKPPTKNLLSFPTFLNQFHISILYSVVNMNKFIPVFHFSSRCCLVYFNGDILI